MKLVVLGANGRTGSHVVRLALEEGDDVTVVVRNAAKRPQMQHDRLNVAIGDPCDPDFLGGVFRDKDAVISTLGGRRPTKKANAVFYQSADAIVRAAEVSGLSSVVVTSSALLFPLHRWTDRVLSVIARRVVEGATRMERTLFDTDLDVVIARCGFLTNDPETQYRVLPDALPRNGSSVSRIALARFLLASVNAQAKGHYVYGVSRPEPGYHAAEESAFGGVRGSAPIRVMSNGVD